jgi:hypothetical protein
MIHIKKSKGGQFRVVNSGRNGEILKTSENLKTKQSAWKNIKADYIENYTIRATGIFVQDDTLTNPKTYRMTYDGVKVVEGSATLVICK